MDENKIALLAAIRALHLASEEYIESIPSDLGACVYDNGYTDCLHNISELLLKAHFGVYYTDVSYFLYEWRPQHSSPIVVDGVDVDVTTIEKYYDYLRKYCK